MSKWGVVILKRKSAWKRLQEIWYRLDWRNRKLINLQKWFEESLKEIGLVENFRNSCEEFKAIKGLDDRAVAILSFINERLTYVGDSVTWKVEEKWQTPYETHKIRKGDCEDGVLLMAAYFYFSEIPSYQWRVECGLVNSPNRWEVGHAYLVYTSERSGLEFAMDWCYYCNLKSLRDRYSLDIDSNYRESWFAFNNSESWKQFEDPRIFFWNGGNKNEKRMV